MREIIKALKITVILWILTAIIYPGLMLLIGAFLPQAQGSLIYNKNRQVIGSALIGQPFTSDKYFWSRPSSINYATGNDIKTATSGGSNLAPSNKKALIDERIKPEINRLKNANVKPTADLIYASGSGLDPHISVQSAYNQVERVAKNRFLPVNQVQNLIPKYTENSFLGIFGEDGVNVLKLNLALDDMK
ncbi:MAG TPA: K(+)-transporting ATPase subunit C [Allocoleopsis sp.]